MDVLSEFLLCTTDLRIVKGYRQCAVDTKSDAYGAFLHFSPRRAKCRESGAVLEAMPRIASGAVREAGKYAKMRDFRGPRTTAATENRTDTDEH